MFNPLAASLVLPLGFWFLGLSHAAEVAEAPKPLEIFSSMNESLSALREREKQPPYAAMIVAATEDKDYLLRLVSDARPSKAYLLTLKLDADLLQDAVKAVGTPRIEVPLTAASGDLRVKVIHSKKALNAVTGLGDVKVQVVTYQNGMKVDDYLVRANPVRFHDRKNPLFPFNNPSSPTDRDLPAGNYMMWGESTAHQGKDQQVTIGGNGEPKQTIKLLVD